jgi:hypothetical protein
MEYKVTIDEDFCKRRNEWIAKDTRGESARMNWDFEYPEHHISRVSGSMHKKWEGGVWKGNKLTHHSIDTIHEFFGACDFKYLKKNRKVHIGNFPLRNLREGVLDHIILWEWVKHPNNWKDIIQPGETGVYRIVDHIPAKDILDFTDGNVFDYNEYLSLKEDEKYLNNL